jgi:hypothetical protein
MSSALRRRAVGGPGVFTNTVNGTDNTVKAFNTAVNVDIGAEPGSGNDRYVVVLMTGMTEWSGQMITSTSMTIGGVSATEVAKSDGTGGTFGTASVIYFAKVNTGTTANIVWTVSSGGRNCRCQGWSIHTIVIPNTLSLTVSDSGSQKSVTTPSVSLNVPAGDTYAFGVYTANNDTNTGNALGGTLGIPDTYSVDTHTEEPIAAGAMQLNGATSGTINFTYSGSVSTSTRLACGVLLAS